MVKSVEGSTFSIKKFLESVSMDCVIPMSLQPSPPDSVSHNHPSSLQIVDKTEKVIPKRDVITTL